MSYWCRTDSFYFQELSGAFHIAVCIAFTKHLQIGVSEHVGNSEDILPVVHPDTRSGVPQLVRAQDRHIDPLLPVILVHLAHEHVIVPAAPCPRTANSTTRCANDKLALVRSAEEQLDIFRRQRNVPPAEVVLRLADLDTHLPGFRILHIGNAVANVQDLLRTVQIAPAKPEQLRPRHAVIQHQIDADPVPVRHCVLQYKRALLLGVDVLLGCADSAFQLDADAGVPADDVIEQRTLKDAVQCHLVLFERFKRQFLTLGVEILLNVDLSDRRKPMLAEIRNQVIFDAVAIGQMVGAVLDGPFQALEDTACPGLECGAILRERLPGDLLHGLTDLVLLRFGAGIRLAGGAVEALADETAVEVLADGDLDLVDVAVIRLFLFRSAHSDTSLYLTIQVFVWYNEDVRKVAISEHPT